MSQENEPIAQSEWLAARLDVVEAAKAFRAVSGLIAKSEAGTLLCAAVERYVAIDRRKFMRGIVEGD